MGSDKKSDDEEELEGDLDNESVNIVGAFSYANLPSWHPDAEPQEEGRKS